MRLKLDENLGSRGAALLIAAGHDVATVVEQGMSAASDTALIEACQAESRALVTLDLDFANPLHFPPRRYAGIAVLRLPDKPGRRHLLDAMQTLANHLAQAELSGRLWIIELGRVREHQPPMDANE